ncbi:LegC family aminotransferase [Clostridium sp. DL1XJH146]
MENKISLSVPNLSLDILENVRETIQTGWVSSGGGFIYNFENEVARYVNVPKAIAVQSGTAGLHLALKVLGVEEDDEVIVPTLTFIAAVNPVRYLKAEPIFMDCDHSLNMDMDKLEEFLEEECTQSHGMIINKKTKRNIKAIIVVHIFGNPIDIQRLMDIKEKYNLKVIEDATEALGSYYLEGEYEGCHCGTIGDIGVYSFNANKIITAGGGGMVVSRDANLLEKIRYLSNQAKEDSYYFVHDEVGYNYRMTNVQAAFGISQMAKIEEFIQNKIKNYEIYKKAVDDIYGIDILPFKINTRANHWFYSLIIDEDEYGMDRNELMDKFDALSIQTRPLWKLNHKQKPYIKNQTYKIDRAEFYEKNLLNIPCSSNLTLWEIQQVVDCLQNK